MKYVILFLFLFNFSPSSIAQLDLKICKAVKCNNFKKVDRLVKRQIKSIPISEEKGIKDSSYVSMDKNIELLTQWFKNMECIQDAFDDRCQNKIMIYPGWSIIGVMFKIGNESIERCFSIQKGTTGTINIFGWRPKISRSKNKLVFKVSYECPGFIIDQKRICVKNNGK